MEAVWNWKGPVLEIHVISMIKTLLSFICSPSRARVPCPVTAVVHQEASGPASSVFTLGGMFGWTLREIMNSS